MCLRKYFVFIFLQAVNKCMCKKLTLTMSSDNESPFRRDPINRTCRQPPVPKTQRGQNHHRS